MFRGISGHLENESRGFREFRQFRVFSGGFHGQAKLNRALPPQGLGVNILDASTSVQQDTWPMNFLLHFLEERFYLLCVCVFCV